ncbi:glycosyltransferase family 1 protein [Mucilaginibacter sp. L196]|uniref:glycosyltransferase family 4 protein n=1 Tax=Mucilaginibacter sp. L196 TaxID=1641870 RepID=UPI00131D7EBE|nr:glycosyltransferase family 1 protein [Mucilaginibacter sp. L196]
MPGITFVAPNNIIDIELAKILDVKVIGSHTGVLWEQYDLPVYLYRNKQPLLINFCNVAPLIYKNQIITIHDVAFMVNPSWFNKKFVIFYKFLIPRIAKKAKMILTVSDFSKREIVNYLNVPSNKINVVYNGISNLAIQQFEPNKYGSYILIVGSIDQRKNIHRLIQAFNKVNNNNIKLLIAGDISPIFNNKNNNSLKSNEKIIFLGRVNDEYLATLYTNALLFVYPSLYEGFGIPPLEAMYYNCPTIVADIESLKEICGEASLFVNPYNIDDIAEKIEFLTSDERLRNNLIEKGKENIKKYSWENSANIVAYIIKNLNQ